MIENEAAGVTRLRAEVVKVEVQSLHDAGGDKNRRTPWKTQTAANETSMKTINKQEHQTSNLVCNKRPGKLLRQTHLSSSSARPGRRQGGGGTRRCHSARAWRREV